jgi:3-oxoacyl-[acyl-carrier protein] reductase
MKRLKDKVAVITQAGSYFGRAVAESFADEGANLYLQDWKEGGDVIHQLSKDIQIRSKTKVAHAVWDITSGKQTLAMTEDIITKYGKIDILVNTAMDGGHGILFDIREPEWDRCIDRGLKSYFLTCQYIGEEMARIGYGKIINITSIVGKMGSAGSVPWGACRGGVDALTYGLAQSLGEYGVRCVGLARGATDSTPYTDEALATRLSKIPFKRLGTEKDITGPAIFLATDESDWITGSIIYADAGYAHAAATDLEHRATEYPLKKRGTKHLDTPRAKEALDQFKI